MRYLSAVLATVLVLTASGALALMMDVFSLEPIHGKSKRCSLVPQQPALSVLPIQQSYSAAIGSTQRSTFTVANTGNAAATGLAFDSFSSAAFSHATSATNPCGTTLAAKASCNKDVLYTGTSGTQTGTLVIESDQYPPTGYASLTGKGLAPVVVCGSGTYTGGVDRTLYSPLGTGSLTVVRGQSFTPTASGYLHSTEFWQATNLSATLTCRIGTALNLNTYIAETTATTSGYGLITILWPTHPDMVSGTKYYVACNSSNTSISFSNSNIDIPGGGKISGTSTAWSSLVASAETSDTLFGAKLCAP